MSKSAGVLLLAVTTAACGAENWSFDADAGAEVSDSAGFEDADASLSADSAEDRFLPLVDVAAPTNDAVSEAGPETDAARRCSADVECTDDEPHCDQTAGVCTRCTAALDCASAEGGPVCAVSAGKCVQCASSADCSASATLPYCDMGSNLCVRCLTTADCGRESFCQPASHTCTPAI